MKVALHLGAFVALFTLLVTQAQAYTFQDHLDSIVVRTAPEPLVPDFPLPHELHARAASKRCKSYADCGRNHYCSTSTKTCTRKKADGERCAGWRSCVSGSCDSKSGTCQSWNLHRGTKCTSSASCKTGNCQKKGDASYCTVKSNTYAYCYKNSNCRTGVCDLAKKRCAVPQNPDGQNPPELQPSLPWKGDGHTIAAIDPVSSVQLFFTDSGTFDVSASQLFAALKADFNMPAVVLSHSSRIGAVSCQTNEKNTKLVVPFSDWNAYARAKKTWSAQKGRMLLVSHTDGCGKADSLDERTIWLIEPTADRFAWDDKEMDVDVKVVMVATEDVVGEMKVDFGTTPGTNTPGTGTPGTGTPGTGTPGTGTPGTGTPGTNPTPGGDGPTKPSGSYTCDKPATGKIDGFPAAGCGPDFDAQLDEALGFFNLNDGNDFSTELKDFAPGLGDFDEADYDSDGNDYTEGPQRRHVAAGMQRGHGARMIHRRHRAVALHNMHLQRRGFLPNPLKLVKSAFKAVVKVGVEGYKAGAGLALQVVSKTPIGLVVDYVLDKNPLTVDKTLSLEVAPPKNKNKKSQKWGDQYLIFETSKKSANDKVSASLDLYCVDCGIKGNAHFVGTVTFSLADKGIKSGTIRLDGGLVAKLQLGLEAEFSFKESYKKNLITYPLGGIAVRDIILIGPAISLDAKVNFGVEAKGNLLMGGSFGIPNFEAVADFTDKSKSYQKGFEPKFTPVFEAEGEIELSTALAFPVSVAFGVRIKPISFDKSLAITSEASVGAKAKFAFDTTKDTNEDCNGGINWAIVASEEVSLKVFDLPEYSLFKWPKDEKPLKEDCVIIKKLGDGKGSGDGKDDGDGKTGSDAGTTPGSGDAGSTGGDDKGDTKGDGDSTPGSGSTSGDGEGSGSSGSDDDAGGASGDGNDGDDGGASGDDSSAGDGSDGDSDNADGSTDGEGEGEGEGDQETEGGSMRRSVNVALRGRRRATRVRRSFFTARDESGGTEGDDDNVWNTKDIDFEGDQLDADTYKELEGSTDQALDALGKETPEEAGNGVEFVQIKDVSGKYILESGPDGTLNVQSANTEDGGAIFAAYENIIGYNGDQDILSYFPELMDKYGVSRFRLSPTEKMINTSDFVTLVPVNADDDTKTDGVFLAFNTQGAGFYPIVCNFKGDAPAKVFLGKDVEESIKTLKSGKVTNTVTGGEVTECQFLALVSSGFAGL